MPHRSLAWIARGLAWMLGIGVLTLLLASGVMVRPDTALYDLNQRSWHYTPDDDVVVVAIDPKTLSALGRWPLPRSLHAKLIDRLTDYGVRGIGMDVTMSSPDTDHPENDDELVQAIRRNDKVIMPMFAEAVDLGGPLEETLPLPAFARSAAGIGHVDVARDADGMVRGAYLTAGLGRPYWPALALALHRMDRANSPASLPGLRDPAPGEASPYLWMRDHYVLLRYADPVHGFGRVSYADVIAGTVPAALLKGRWVLVGATAEGMGDIIQTPGARIPGVEYQANLFESLQRGWLVTPLGFPGQLALGAGMLLLPLLIHGLPGFRRTWRVVLLTAVLLVASSLCLLRVFYLWWPPTACLLILATGFAAWSLLTWRSTAIDIVASGQDPLHL